MKTLATVLILCVYHTISQAQLKPAWQRKADCPFAGVASAVTYKGKIYVAKFDNTILRMAEYNPQTDAWKIKNGSIHYPNVGLSCMVSSDSGIYIMGGLYNNVCLKKMVKYDVEHDKFITLGDMPQAFNNASAFSYENRVYIMCGMPDLVTLYSNNLYEYDIASDKWYKKTSAVNGHYEAHVQLSRGRAFITGGTVFDLKTSEHWDNKKIDIYYAIDDFWYSDEKNLVGQDSFITNFAVLQNEFYFFVKHRGNDSIEDIFKYNEYPREITKITSRINKTGAMVLVSLGDSIYLTGGFTGMFPGVPQKKLELFRMISDPLAVRTQENDNVQCIYNNTNQCIEFKNLKSYNALSVSIYNFLGVPVTKKQLHGEMNSVSTLGIPKGCYLVVLDNRSFKVAIY